METEFDYIYASSEDDDFSTDSSEDSDEPNSSDHEARRKSTHSAVSVAAAQPPTIESASQTSGVNNLLLKFFNRERTGCFSGGAFTQQLPQRAFSKVPNRLGFCLKDIVPHCFLQGHMFMGLSACGQFLLSYKVSCNDNIRLNHYSLNIGYSYTLYFWIYQPHKPLRTFYKCCLFDDHGVDSLKHVTMTQWKCTDPRVLIVHGTAEDEHEDSYITYVKVPKLGCLDCKKLREFDDDGLFRCYALCLKCNLTIHTKYSTTESDRAFDPRVNLICPGRILIIANGFVHMLHVDVDLPAATLMGSTQLLNHGTTLNSLMHAVKATPPYDGLPSSGSGQPGLHERRPLSQASNVTPGSADEDSVCDNHNNIVARIIADFSDIETDSTHSNSMMGAAVSGGSSGRAVEVYRSVGPGGDAGSCVATTTPGSVSSCGGSVSRKTYDELIFTCNGSSPGSSSSVGGSPAAGGSSSGTAIASKSGGSTRVSLINHTGRRHHRIVTKSFRNGVTTVDLQSTSPATTSTGASATAADKSNAYEFSEDNEKCEKIATLRKRRLAEKKYEFSEDNSENIIPFTKIRSAARSFGGTLGGLNVGTPLRTHHRAASTGHHFHNSPCASPSSSPHPHTPYAASPNGSCDARHYTPPPMHRMSPITLQQQQHHPSHQQEFRSPPCNSPVGAGLMRSPSRHAAHGHMSPSMAAQIYVQKSPPQPLSAATQHMLSFKPLLGALSPLQLSLTKRNHLELSGAMSPNTNVPFLSPRREEQQLYRAVEVPLQGDHMPEKPMCTKKFRRRYVEEDDAASVITSEEDDCISPGYHTSLPMEVHGSCYAEMQMISQASYQRLRCASIIVTQHSFDLETFTYYVIGALCQKNAKIYDVFYDWACELINVCPLSQTIACLLMAQFTARDQQPSAPSNCLNCSRKLDCAFHRRQFECRILFTWNMESGEWEVLDYGEMHECKPANVLSSLKWSISGTTKTTAGSGGSAGYKPFVNLAERARKLAHELSNSLKRMQPNYADNLRVLDSNVKKSKMCITDHDNMIELHLKRPRLSGH